MTRTRLSTIVLLLVALAMTACDRTPADPEDRLADAFATTFDGSFDYSITVDADQAALQGLGEGAGEAASFLTGFQLRGTVDGDAASVIVEAIGTNLLEFRAMGDDRFYAQLGIQQLLGLAGPDFDPAAQVGPQLDQLGVSAEVREAVLEAFEGNWVGIEGELDPSRVAQLAGDQEVDEEEAEARFEEIFGEDVPTFFDRYVTLVEHTETDGVTTYEVQLQLHDLLRAAAQLNSDLGLDDQAQLQDLEADLEELPETVPGTVVTADDVLTEIRFDVAQTIRDTGTEIEGDLDLLARMSNHGEVDPITEPEGATVITADQLEEALITLNEVAGGGATEGSTEGATEG
jgi:hypothetical protein